MREDFTFSLRLEVARPIHGAQVTCVLKDAQGRRASTFFSPDQDFTVTLAPGVHLVRFRVRALPLAPGRYLVDLGINQSNGTVAYDVILDYPVFEVVTDRQVLHWLDRPWGSVHWRQVEWSSGAP